MKRTVLNMTAAALALSVAAVSGCAGTGRAAGAGAYGTAGRGTLLATVVKDMGDDGTVLDSIYDALYKEGSAEKGIRAIIESGNYRINAIALPRTAAEFAADGYAVNENRWLVRDADGTYTLERDTYASYLDGALGIIRRLPAGLETRIYDTDGDGFADSIDADYYDGIIVNGISRDTGGTVTVSRGSIDSTLSYPANAGRTYDGSLETVTLASFDDSIKEGDVALLWRAADGWHIRRAEEVRGVFTGGGDHEYYEIDGARYQDAMRFSRDNIIISNRPGEYANVRGYFGFAGNARAVSLWLVPVSDGAKQGAPVSLTSGESAAFYLEQAISFAQDRLDSVAVSADGSDVAAGTEWTAAQYHAELADAVSLAQAALKNGGQDDLLDYQTYLLFLTLHGSADDIGARYGGFNFAGFENQVHGHP